MAKRCLCFLMFCLALSWLSFQGREEKPLFRSILFTQLFLISLLVCILAVSVHEFSCGFLSDCPSAWWARLSPEKIDVSRKKGIKASNQVQPFPGAVTLPMTHAGEVWLSTPPTCSTSLSWEGGQGPKNGKKVWLPLPSPSPGPAHLASGHQRRHTLGWRESSEGAGWGRFQSSALAAVLTRFLSPKRRHHTNS